MPLFPKPNRREFRYTPFLYREEREQDLRQRLSLRRPANPVGVYKPLVKWAFMLALALAIYQFLHPETLLRLTRPPLTITVGDQVEPGGVPGAP